MKLISKKLDRDKIIQELVETEIEMLSDGEIMDILEFGCRGYRDLDDEELIDMFLGTHEEEFIKDYWIKDETDE